MAMGVGIAELRESLSDYAAGFDPALLSATQAERVVDEASRIENIAATLKALAAARVAETGSWRAAGDRSAAHHLARRTGTTVAPGGDGHRHRPSSGVPARDLGRGPAG